MSMVVASGCGNQGQATEPLQIFGDVIWWFDDLIENMLLVD